MPANIFGERFISHREPAWHRLGTVFEDADTTAVDAVTRAGLDYRIAKAPLTATLDGVTLATDQFALVREATTDDPTPRILGVVGANYSFLQNRELAELADRELTKVMPVETAGALGHGETFFLCLDAGDGEIVPGEHVHHYFLLTDTRNGGQSLQIAYTPVRVVCQNTLTSGLSAATVKWSIPHHDGHRQSVSDDTHLIGALHAAQGRLTEQMRHLAESKITTAQVDHLLTTVYAEPKIPHIVRRVQSLGEFGITLDAPAQQFADRRLKSTLADRERIALFRDGARELYARINDEYPRVAESAWAIYNAVVECEDYRNGFGNVDQSVVFGERARRKADAFRAASALAQ